MTASAGLCALVAIAIAPQGKSLSTVFALVALGVQVLAHMVLHVAQLRAFEAAQSAVELLLARAISHRALPGLSDAVRNQFLHSPFFAQVLLRTTVGVTTYRHGRV